MAFIYKDAFLTLASLDGERLVQFYRQFFQLDPQSYIPHRYGEFRLQGLRLGIFTTKVERHNEFADSARSGMSLCLEVDDLEIAIAHLTNLGYPPPGEIISNSHGREIYGYDPDGNRLILHQS